MELEQASLKDALKRVLKVTQPKEAKSVSGFVRTIPANVGYPARVYATDGVRGSSVWVDVDLPNNVFPAWILAKAIKEPGDLILNSTGYGNFELISGVSTYQIMGSDPVDYPAIPQFPSSYYYVDGWGTIAKAFHAVSRPQKDTVEASLVHFTPKYVESTDRHRLARVGALGPWSGLVHSTVFKGWPRDDVGVFFSENCAYFNLGPETRIGFIQHCDYPKLENVLPLEHVGPSALVSTNVLRNCCKRAADISAYDCVGIEFRRDQLSIWAWEKENPQQIYQGNVRVYQGVEHSGVMVVNGKYLTDAMKVISTPTVRVCYNDRHGPLRLESGSLVCCIWQVIE